MRCRQSGRGEEIKEWQLQKLWKKRQRARQNGEADFRATERRLCKQVRLGGDWFGLGGE